MSLPILPSGQKFSCCQCGSCCSKIRGMMPAEDAAFMKEMAYGKMPLVQLIPLEKISFPLYDWEAKRFMGWQHDANVDAKIRPSRAIFDLNTNKAIIATYSMDSDACPFLKNSKCSIYDKKRAYICRLFPFNRTPFLDVGERLRKENLFGTCGGMKSVLPHIPESKSKMIAHLQAAFPDGSFENAVQHDIVIEWLNSTVVDLMRKKIVRPAMNYPYEFLLKRINNAEKIDFTDFLVGSGYMPLEEKDSLIEGFDSNSGAKRKITEFIESC